MSAFIDELTNLLGPDLVSVDLADRQAMSQDAAYLSPILVSTMPATVADVVARPLDAYALADAVALAVRHRVPITARGKGTGNYGQAVPFQQGLVLDLTRMSTIHDLSEGWVHADAGATFLQLEAAARAVGQELSMFPSTTASTIGGFIGGGAGGSGSVEHGFIWHGGFALDSTMIPAWDAPSLLDVDTLPYMHSYGTTGVLSTVRVRLQPAHERTALFSSFPAYGAARQAGFDLSAIQPVPRLVSLSDPRIVSTFPSEGTWQPDQWSLRMTLDKTSVPEVERIVKSHGGAVDFVRDNAQAMVGALSFNHVTLRVKRRHPGIFHLQVQGANPEAVYEAFPDGMLHHDFYRYDGVISIGGLLFAPFTDERSVMQGIDHLEANGVTVVNPHTWLVGSHGGLDGIYALAAQYDPHGLLNPGKLPVIEESAAVA
jgi:FAD/FMN-containing dehydrogenase